MFSKMIEGELTLNLRTVKRLNFKDSPGFRCLQLTML